MSGRSCPSLLHLQIVARVYGVDAPLSTSKESPGRDGSGGRASAVLSRRRREKPPRYASLQPRDQTRPRGSWRYNFPFWVRRPTRRPPSRADALQAEAFGAVTTSPEWGRETGGPVRPMRSFVSPHSSASFAPPKGLRHNGRPPPVHNFPAFSTSSPHNLRP